MSRVPLRRTVVAICFVGSLFGLTVGLNCPSGGDLPLDPGVPSGNRPPRIVITGITTPTGDNSVAQGDQVLIAFIGEDGEDACRVKVFASIAATPTPAQQIPILSDLPIGPGIGSGAAVWDTTGVPAGSYNIFAEIDDGTFDSATGTGNPPVRVTASTTVQVILPPPPGSTPLPIPPQLVFVDPLANIGLSSQDELTIRYIYADPDSSSVTVTLLLDTDLISSNDDVNNPGDPLDPNTKIIILPSTARLPTDPTFPDLADTNEIRTNPRVLGQTPPNVYPYPGAPLAGSLKEYRFTIDFSKIPVRTQPYYIRATIADEFVTKHFYAVGSLTITSLASGVVNVGNLGFSVAGGRFQGFSQYENLGTDFMAATDLDLDGVGDFMIASRFGRPRNRPGGPGAAYLIFGRRKTPFPPDTNGNGIPDVTTPGGVVDFPTPPDYLPNPYDSRNVGRFGGVLNINSINNFFRGAIYGMPTSYSAFGPPPEQGVPAQYQVAGYKTAGLTSITQLDMTRDGTPDFVFGLPFSAALDYIDDDPVDGGCDIGAYDSPGGPLDQLPNYFRCDQVPANDDMHDSGAVEQGLVIMVDGRNDIRNIFPRFVDAGLAGQFDPSGPVDDEGTIHGRTDTPNGMHFRGGWWDWVFPSAFQGPEPDPLNEYGTTVAALPSIDNDQGDELLVSSPGYPGVTPDGTGLGRGRVTVWLTNDFTDPYYYGEDGVLSLPGIMHCPGDDCRGPLCCRRRQWEPNRYDIYGQQAGDRFGYAGSAGQFNQDGMTDILAGSPGADRNGLTDNGVFYVIFTPQGGIHPSGVEEIPHLRITGVKNDDRFGLVQTAIGDINGDGNSDIAFASESWDDALGPDQGYVGVIFGNRPLTGEHGFTPDQVGTPQLSGIRFIGPSPGALAGHDISSAGDFNSDGFGDLLISAPGATRTVTGQVHQGVVYLIFGGPQLRPGNACNGNPSSNVDNTFNLSQVGTLTLPGIVFYGRIINGSDPLETNAALDTVGALGDVDGDGFDDIAIGATKVDFVNPAEPNQRRIDAGEVYIIYGSNYGKNLLTCP
jgi:hypothetical protein